MSEMDRIGPPSETVNTHQLLWDVTDNIWDHASLDEPWAEWFIEHIEEPVKALICERDGHVIIDDQCLIPKHRYCAICGKRETT